MKPAFDAKANDKAFGGAPRPAPVAPLVRLDFSMVSPGYLCAPLQRHVEFLLALEAANRVNGSDARAQILNEGISVIEEVLKRTRAKLQKEARP